mgnify:CR=1 FL=1
MAVWTRPAQTAIGSTVSSVKYLHAQGSVSKCKRDMGCLCLRVREG